MYRYAGEWGLCRVKNVPRLAPVVLSLLLAVGCAAGPDYKRPKVALPSSYRFETGTAAAPSLVDLPWWQMFGDNALRALVEEALRNNYDLLAATARVDAARAQARAAGAQLLPSVTIGGTGADANSFGGTPAGKSFYTAGATGTASWEIDLFGRLRRTAEAARAEYAASEEARRGVWVTVLADVGQSYSNCGRSTFSGSSPSARSSNGPRRSRSFEFEPTAELEPISTLPVQKRTSRARRRPSPASSSKSR